MRGTFNIMDYWKIIRRGRWTILAVFTIVVGLVALWTFTQTPIYRAVATVEVRSETRRVLPGQDVSGMGATGFGWAAEERFYNTQIEILQSRDLAERVIQKAGLQSDPAFAGLRDPVAALAGMIRAQPRTDTGIIEISMSGADPIWITKVVNVVADEYVERNIETARKSLSALLGGLKSEVDDLSNSTKAAEQQKFREARDSGLIVPEKQRDVLADQLAKYMEAHTQTRIAVAQLRARIQSFDEARSAGADPLSITEIAQLPQVTALLQQRSEMERELEGLSVAYLPGHPEMQKRTSELEAVKTKLADAIARTVDGWRAELKSKAQIENELASQIAGTRAQLLDVGQRSSDYEIASRDAGTKARVYDSIQGKLNEITVSSGLLLNNINLLDRATVPNRPIRPRKGLNLFLGALFGMLAGIGVTFVLDHLDNTVKSMDDIEQGLGLPVLSIVPRYRESTGHAVREAFQTLKTNVLFSSQAKERNLLLLTSAGPKEGKSSTVANLAKTIASGGERVVVVDCDLRRPTVHIHLGLERDHGLTNYLTGVEGDDLTPFLKETKTPNLYALTCGPIPPNPAELFNGERFRKVLRELRTRFDWVLIDSPPVVSLTDSVILASMADMVAFIVKHNGTEREMIRRCLQNIRNVNAHVIGAILNNVDIEKSFSKDYYYAGYYYSSEGEGKDKKAKRRREASAVASGSAPSA